MDQWKIPSLKKYVARCKNKNEKELKKIASEWMKVCANNKIDYEVEWLGVPIIQTSEDIVLMQELIFKLRPDYIIETGIAHGGSLIYYASLMELLNKGKVIGVDIEIRQHNRKVIEAHPMFKRIEMIEDGSTSDKTIKEIKKRVAENSKVIVCLDSNHTKDHVFKELELYKEFIIPGFYFVVFDMNTSELARTGVCDSNYLNNGPKEAVEKFLKKNNNFEIDKEYNKLYVSTSENGYLRRIK